MKILYLNKTAEIGGAEMSLFRLIKSLPRKDFTPLVILPSGGPYLKKLTEAGIETRIIKRLRIGLKFGFFYTLCLPLKFISYTYKLLKIIKRERIDLIHTNSYEDGVYAGLASKLSATPHLCHVRDILPPSWKRKAWIKLINLFSDRIIAVSQAVERTFAESKKNLKTEVIYGAIDPDEFSPESKGDKIKQEFGLKDNDFLVVNIGKLIPLKGQELFLKAAHRILKTLPQTKFMIVGIPFRGKEDYARHIKRITQDLSIEANVIFTGFRSDIPLILEAADVYVHSGILPDAFPSVLLEAMASAKPVIAPRCGGIPELIQDNVNGKLYPAGDIDVMTTEIMSLLKNNDLREKLGSAARSHIGENFTLRKHIKKMKEVYWELFTKVR